MKLKSILFAVLFIPFSIFSQTTTNIPTNGLIAHYPFNGNANDISGNGNNGTPKNVALSSDRFGNPNSAYLFNGKDSRIDINNAIFNVGWENYTISCWTNSSSLANPNNVNDGQNVINTDPHNGFAINMYNSNNPFTPTWNNKYVLFAGSQPNVRDWDITTNSTQSNANRTINTWNHLVVVKSGLNYSLYINGVLDKIIVGAKAANSYMCKLVIGNLAADIPNEGFLGKLDDYSIWNRALTITEISNIYNNTSSKIDLSLKSFSQKPIIQKDSTGIVTFTLKNEGQNTATNVKVLLSIPYSPPFVIKNTQNCSKGTFDSNMWTIPSLAAGDSCVLNVVYQPTQNGVWYVEAEVFSSDQSDTDSEANNKVDTEDDFTRTCFSIPIKTASDTFGMQLILDDSKIDVKQWFKDGAAITGSNSSTLQITSVGKYSYSTQVFKCPTQGCCPFIIEKTIIPASCCVPLEYILGNK